MFVGLFLASVPSIFGLNTSDAFETDGNGIWVWSWPVIFATSFAPAAIMNVYGENVLKDTSELNASNNDNYGYSRKQRSKRSIIGIGSIAVDSIEDVMTDPEVKNVNIWYYLFIQSIIQELTIISFIWLDFIPQFGSESNIENTLKEIGQDWKYFFGMDGAGSAVTVRAIVFIGCYTCMLN